MENEIEEEMKDDRPVVKKDYYFNEAMNITLDFLRAKQAPGAAQVGKRN